jgi:hypothetical protein
MLFTRKQQEFRKDVERAFGVLQAKFQICKGPSRFWYPEDIVDIMDCVVILHNMALRMNDPLISPGLEFMIMRA